MNASRRAAHESRANPHAIFPPESDSGNAATCDGADVRKSIETLSPPVSVAGVVDAILDVSRQRKALLDQARSALLSGDDAAALRCTRLLCGLPVERIQ
jgi:hypothetical protein